MVLFTRAPPPTQVPRGCWTGGHTGTGPTWSCMGSTPDQAGTYHCKAWNDAGAVRSGTARLTVLGKHPR